MTASRAMSRLPIQASPLVGRAREVRDISDLLKRPDVRLVTLTGTGGIGKTRLAMGVVEALPSSFADEVVLVSLASIRDPALVIPTLAQGLGVREQAGVSARDGLVSTIADRRILFILDNCEQIRGAATDVSWILAVCANIKVFVTSRARLHIRGEHEFPVPPLPLPAASASDPDEIDQNAAVQLFMQRATEVQPGLVLSATTRHVVAEICRRLDGLPLAIELAAARVKVLPPAALLGRLGRRLPLLTGGAHDLPDRLRTMTNAIAWSYDNLPTEEQALFRTLSVFSGGFSLHESEALIAGDSPLLTQESADDSAASAALNGLANLVDNSLVLQQELEAEPRFQILETLREFGLEQLEKAGEQSPVRDRHADFFIGFAEAAIPRLRGAERTSWLERLGRAHDNLRAALTWLCEQNDTVRAVRLAGALWQFWWWRSHLGEGRQRLEQVLALPGAESTGVWWARALTGAGALAETQGDYPASEAFHERAVATWQKLGDTRGLAISLLFRWLVAFNADDQKRMAALSSESLRLFQELDDPWGIAMSQMEQGVQAMRRSDHSAADRVLDTATTGFRNIDDSWGIAICQGVAGSVATDRGDYAAAGRLLNESLTSLVLLDDLWGVATVMPAVARMASDQGAYERAACVSGAVKHMHRTLGAPLKVPFRERYEHNLELARIELGESRFASALAEGEAMSPAEAVNYAIAPVEPGEPISTAMDSLAIALSPREREVVRLVPGRTAREIGATLFISESTVRTHIENIFNKLGVRNQKELIGYIYEHKLI